LNDRAAFVKLAAALSPWLHQLVFVGGWAHRLFRLHPRAQALAYEPLATLDADVAFARQEELKGNVREQLLAAGFTQHLTGEHHPPVSRYTLGEDETSGFYAEFLTPLVGREIAQDGRPNATTSAAGVTAQRLRYLEVLLQSPWSVTLDHEWGAASPIDLQIPNPVSFIVQKLLVLDRRPRGKQAQDILYIHDTLELFAPELDALARIWRANVRGTLHDRWERELHRARARVFGEPNDQVRDAAAMPQDRELDPERMRAMCRAALGEIFE